MKTFVDVSHIIGWSGNLTGIERVEYHIILHYYQKTNAEFIYWDDEAAIFCIADRQFISEKIINRAAEPGQKQAAEATLSVFKRAKRKLKQTRKTDHAIPEGTIIVLDGLWDKASYIRALEELAKDHELIHVVYDMIPAVQKGYVVDFLPPVFENYMYKVLPLCKGILAISESTARDTRAILEAKGLPVPKIMTFRLGDDAGRTQPAVKPKGMEGDFILSVGTVEARKNHMLLYYAYKSLLSQNKAVPKLIIAGRRGWLSGDFQYIIEHDEELQGKITILDTVNDSALRWLYENCLFTVFPSFYEGWGLPIAESLGYGKVTLSSNTSSMPEVGGKFADYFSPYASEELASLIMQYVQRKVLTDREKFIQQNYKPALWEDAATTFAGLAAD